ncbi:hypothetical protein EV356DRAFT_563475 [Viridothelium virens]|uniref:Zn(2)-C6 fungal-type domain-containing protein n=1 Tax=Viridothelium virens TaxID=1048519 RepID=A0A6A6HLR0_VIRVR|nr:hypothetical protein EV356DRAFT_563475 [Viridothelium virens]
MESRREDVGKRAEARPAIARRSCDQCRTRKIGCDRGLPCSNCVTARVDCTHSAVASNAKTPRQRVLISAKYEQKIDDIARDVGGIKLLLQVPNAPSAEKWPVTRSQWNFNPVESVKPLIQCQSISALGGEPLWDHSAQIVDFVKAVSEDRSSRDVRPESSEVLSSLRKLVQALEDPIPARGSSVHRAKPTTQQDNPPMPPLEAVVAALRWAKDHTTFTRIVWISQVLPLQNFTEICRKVYFAADEYSEVDLILANAYLSYIFAEHVVVSGLQDYREYCQLCRENLEDALPRLPLLLPASTEVIAALTLGTFNAVENSKAKVAWKFISAASDLCQTLGYHRLRSQNEHDKPSRAAQERLFWTVYAFEKGLSLRLGRSSNIRDAEITLPFVADMPRSVRLGRINGMVYDQLYSPAGLSRLADERSHMAEILAGDLRELIKETRADISSASDQPSDNEPDPMRATYSQCDLVCQSSLLALILRAIPTAQGSLTGVSDDCVVVARHALDMHERCMKDLGDCKNDPFMVTKYINWAILYCPFVPFSILFTRAVQLSDMADLDRLDRFENSLQPSLIPPEAITHPYRLYKLLCQAARLYFDLNAPSWPTDQTISHTLTGISNEFDLSHSVMEGGVISDESLKPNSPQMYGLYDWWHDSQQIMGLLSEDIMF